ncbi:MAG: histidine--tRNA ligase [Deltaproteobacteria bacterium]|jgi:histidyl-tRNA synthetase|nr:histidine--tRNA ligase [Deltaproteobacteria bacterium]
MRALTAITGFKDVLPSESPLWRLVEEKARDVVRRFDFAELRPPVMERLELFQRGIGQTTDIVEKEMYAVKGRGEDENFALRPEATAGMVRALLEHHLHEGGRPAKIFCLGPMFRCERPQKGRLRQFNQLDVEVFNDPGPLADAEVVALLHTFLHELGIPGLSVSLNSLGCAECRPSYRGSLVAYLEARSSSLCEDCRRRLQRNPLRVLDCKNESCREAAAGAPVLSEYLCGACRDHFGLVLDSLASLGVPHRRDERLVRGLDYYTRTAFEVHSDMLGAQSAMAGGGRYDGLCRELGGPDIPAVGFAVGLERLIMLLQQMSPPPSPGPDYYLAALAPEALGPAFLLAQRLRSLGLGVAADWESGSLKSRLRRADKARAARVVMLGADELAGGVGLVRDLAAGVQKKIPLDRPDLFALEAARETGAPEETGAPVSG